MDRVARRVLAAVEACARQPRRDARRLAGGQAAPVSAGVRLDGSSDRWTRAGPRACAPVRSLAPRLRESLAHDPTSSRPERRRALLLTRTLILLFTPLALASLVFVPANPVLWILDILGRTYLMFLGTVMAHEASHGHLGRGAAANLWWGRLALLPVMVPYANFRKTHPLHHAYTNDPERDPDHFVRPGRFWEIPLRAMTLPHQWFVWLKRHDRIGRRHVRELIVEYALVAAVHVPLAVLVGPARYLGGVVPALVLVSLLLWYPFAIKTHEGWSLARPEARSHDYYGRFMYWFSAGLSLHRAHHMHPELTWLELRAHVESTPADRARWLPQRNVRSA